MNWSSRTLRRARHQRRVRSHGNGWCCRTDISGRATRRGPRRPGRDSRRRSGAHQRRHQRYTVGDDEQAGEYAFAKRTRYYTVRVSLPGSKARNAKASASARSSPPCSTSASRSARSPNRSPSPAKRRSSSVPAPRRPRRSTRKRCRTCRFSAATRFRCDLSTPGVIQTGDPQFVRYQDQSGSSALSIGGGPRRGNGYLIEVCRSPTATEPPDDRAFDGSG